MKNTAIGNTLNISACQPDMLLANVYTNHKPWLQQQVQLADGSQLWLNTNTVVNIDFTHQQRSVWFRSGEIYIETSKTNHTAPLVVHTSMGTVRALGTRFGVRHYSGITAEHCLN